jgi:hypothetical protein
MFPDFAILRKQVYGVSSGILSAGVVTMRARGTGMTGCNGDIAGIGP